MTASLSCDCINFAIAGRLLLYCSHINMYITTAIHEIQNLAVITALTVMERGPFIAATLNLIKYYLFLSFEDLKL